LYGIFGDAQWSNKNKLSDRLLTDLIEHFLNIPYPILWLTQIFLGKRMNT